MDDTLEAICSIIRTLDRGAGLRIHEICAALRTRVAPQQVQALLERAARVGMVRRDPEGGRWRLNEAKTSHAHAPTSSARRPIAPATADALIRPVGGIPIVPDDGIPAERDDRGAIDRSQRAVVDAAASARQVVVAGPGFGKTAVACDRVVALLREGVPSSAILLLSFTRTAVREMRSRIASQARDVLGADAVEIRTLDSFAWRVRTGLSQTPQETLGFGASIDTTVGVLAAPNEDVRAYLDHFAHVLVDEAQDLVGARAALVTQLLSAIRPEAGYTVFLDPAQAIYDWSENAGELDASERFESCLRGLRPAPSWSELQHLHRTRDSQLRALLLGARRLVLDAPDDAHHRVRNALDACASQECSAEDLANELSVRDSSDLMILTRRRAEALELSSWLTQKGVRHRLRFGNLPQFAAAWIAPVLNQAYLGRESVELTSEDIEDAWNAVQAQNPWLCDGWDFNAGWRLLRQLGRGHTRRHVDVRQVSMRLGGATLPDDALLREPGGIGPIVSTVHGSKGREATEAMLLLCEQQAEGIDEARVLYVGLSRAKDRLDVRRYSGMQWNHLEGSGRPWRRTRTRSLQLEVGRAGDLDPARNARVFGDRMADQQQLLATFNGTCRDVQVWSFPDRDWVRGIVEPTDPAKPLATLSLTCEQDLWAAARAMRRKGQAKTPTHVCHLRWFDLGSVGLPRNGEPGSELPEPWKTTGLFLIPLIVGPGIAGGY
jgi:hypothetical protein